MKKVGITISIIIIIALVIIAIVMILGNRGEGESQAGIQIETPQQMEDILNNINTKLANTLPQLETRPIDITDEFAFTSTTGLQSNNNVEAVVVSEPFINAQAYSAVMVKVSDNANIEEMKQEMINGIDMRKWICVSAQKVWVTNYKNIIFLVMADEEWGKPVYDEFKQAVGGSVGKELEKTEEI